MIWLATETSTDLGSIAVFDGNALLGSREWNRSGSHSEFLTISCAELMNELGLNWQQIARVAVGVGPGSFTGIRVAVNFARSASFIGQRSVFAMNSLELMALPFLFENRGPYAVVQSAQYAFRDLIYVAEFAKNGEKIKIVYPVQAITKDEWLTRLSPGKLVVGDATEIFKGDLAEYKENDAGPKARPHAKNFVYAQVDSLRESQLLSWNQVVPLYIRASEAEEKLRRGLLKPL